jgi:hypothetical protein
MIFKRLRKFLNKIKKDFFEPNYNISRKYMRKRLDKQYFNNSTYPDTSPIPNYNMTFDDTDELRREHGYIEPFSSSNNETYDYVIFIILSLLFIYLTKK